MQSRPENPVRARRLKNESNRLQKIIYGLKDIFDVSIKLEGNQLVIDFTFMKTLRKCRLILIFNNYPFEAPECYIEDDESGAQVFVEMMSDWVPQNSLVDLIKEILERVLRTPHKKFDEIF